MSVVDAAPEFIAAGFGIVVAVSSFHDVPISPVGLGHVREGAKLAGVSCSQRYKRSLRARKDSGSLPRGKHNSTPSSGPTTPNRSSQKAGTSLMMLPPCYTFNCSHSIPKNQQCQKESKKSHYYELSRK